MDLTIYPKLNPIRTSWSLYKKWLIKDWVSIWEYYTDQRYIKEPNEGDRVHKKIETEGYKIVKGANEFMKGRYKYEEPIIRVYDKFSIIGRPDAYNKTDVIDWKTGGMAGSEKQVQLYMFLIGEECENGFVVGLDSMQNSEGNIGSIWVRKGARRRYKRSKYVGDWLYRMEEMANDIEYAIKRGRLSKFLRGEI